MHTRTGPAYPPAALEQFTAIRDVKGDQITTGRFPVVNVSEAWELYSTLGITTPASSTTTRKTMTASEPPG